MHLELSYVCLFRVRDDNPGLFQTLVTYDKEVTNGRPSSDTSFSSTC
jgi:hypothetical protein